MNPPVKTPQNPNAVHSIRFESALSGFLTAARERKMMDEAEKLAKAWIWEFQNEIKVISISSSLSSMNAFVTVWYSS